MLEIFSQLHVFRIPLLFILASFGTFFRNHNTQKSGIHMEFSGRMFEHILSVLPPSN